MAQRALLALERSERGPALLWLVPMVEQEEDHETSIAASTRRDIGVAP